MKFFKLINILILLIRKNNVLLNEFEVEFHNYLILIIIVKIEKLFKKIKYLYLKLLLKNRKDIKNNIFLFEIMI